MAEIIQGTDEWKTIRLGKVTASRVSDVLARTKTGPSASRERLMGQLITERLTGVVAEGFTSAAMAWGNETEPMARNAYSFMTDADVAQIGFVPHSVIAMSGASPDGLVGEGGLVEIKCPDTHTHIATLLSEKIPSQYENQMLWQMACTGRQWCDFASFDPRMPVEMRLFVKRLERDADRIATMEAEVTKFLEELAGKVDALRARYCLQEAA